MLNGISMKTKKAFFITIFCLGVLSGEGKQFQTGYGWVLPRLSQPAKMIQSLGVTEIEVSYSRPMVRGREVWGNPKMVPYGKVWRAGANEATTISFSTDVFISGKNLKKGQYAFFLLPKENEDWVGIFNKVHDQWGAFTYDQTKDALQVDVQVSEGEFREALEISFPDLTDSSTTMLLEWGSKKVRIPISVDIEKTSITKANTTFDWQAGFFAADHFMKQLKNYDEALKWTNASIAMQKNLSNLNQKASILALQEDYVQAIEVAKEILEVAKKASERSRKFYEQRMTEQIKEWEDKVNG